MPEDKAYFGETIPLPPEHVKPEVTEATPTKEDNNEADPIKVASTESWDDSRRVLTRNTTYELPSDISELHSVLVKGDILLQGTSDQTIRIKTIEDFTADTEQRARILALQKNIVGEQDESSEHKFVMKESEPLTEESSPSLILIEVPEHYTDLNCKLWCQKGRVEVTNYKGQLAAYVREAKDDASGIVVEKSNGNFQVETMHGLISVTDTDANIDVKTQRGKVVIDKARGTIQVRTTHGDIALSNALLTNSPDTGPSEHRLSAQQGDITVSHLKNNDIKIDARTAAGDILVGESSRFKGDRLAGVKNRFTKGRKSTLNRTVDGAPARSHLVINTEEGNIQII